MKMCTVFTPSVAFSTASCHEHHSQARQGNDKRFKKVKKVFKYKTYMYIFLLCCSFSVVISKSEKDLDYSDKTRISEDRSSFEAKGM